MSLPPDPSAGFPEREASSQSAPRPLTAQDRQSAAALAAAAELVNRVVKDEALAGLLRSQGYDAEELQAGVTLHAAAEEVFTACQQALGNLDQAQATYDEAWVNAREDYVEFRWAVRVGYADPGTQKLLQVHGRVAEQAHEFIAQAATSYRMAQLLQASPSLASLGFAPERLRRALADLRLLARLELTLQARRSGADRQREERDLAIAMLNLWMRDFERAARTALRGAAHPPLSSGVSRGRSPRVGRGPHRISGPRFPSRFRRRFPRSRS